MASGAASRYEWRAASPRALWHVRSEEFSGRLRVLDVACSCAREHRCCVGVSRIGAAGVRIDDWLDTDECAIYITTSNRSYGHAYFGSRAVEMKRYEIGVRFSLLVAVGTRPNEVYYRIYKGERVDSDKFTEFLEGEVHPCYGPGRRFMYGKLRAHLTAQVQAKIA